MSKFVATALFSSHWGGSAKDDQNRIANRGRYPVIVLAGPGVIRTKNPTEESRAKDRINFPQR